MKKRLTRGEKWLFASPLLFLVIASGVVQWRKNTSDALPIPFRVRPFALIPAGAGGHSLEFSPDSLKLAVFNANESGSGAYGYLYDVKTRAKIRDFVPQTNELTNLQVVPWQPPAWSPDGKEIAVVVAANYFKSRAVVKSRKIVIWDVATGNIKAAQTYNPSVRGIEYLRYSKDGKTLIGGGVPPAVFDVVTGKLLKKPDPNIVQSVEYSLLNENLGLIALRDSKQRGNFRVVDAKTKRVLWQPQPQLDSVYGFDWAGDVLIVYGPVNKMARDGDMWSNPLRRIMWDGKTRQLLPAFPIDLGSPGGQYSFSPDHRTIAHAFQQYTRNGKSLNERVFLIAWDYRAGRELWRYEAPSVLFQPQWSPDGKYLMALADVRGAKGRKCELFVFDQSGRLRIKTKIVSDINRWSPDSTKLASIAYQTDLMGKSNGLSVDIQSFKD